MPNNAPRLLFGGTGSNCGKTTVTSAVLAAFRRRGLPLAAFKCGPDYIDPMFHTAALGVPSRNLDLFLSDGDTVRGLLARHAPADGLSVLEGAMGFYDGVSGDTDAASAADLARRTQTPAVLIAQPKGQSLSLAATLCGFRAFAENTLAGVILNGVTAGMYPFYRRIAEKAGLRVYGFLPPVPAAAIPDRHLGLVTAGEIDGLRRKLSLLADAAEDGLDLDGLLALARTAPPLEKTLPPLSPVGAARIAVAQDAAFCFCYADNLEVLRELGAVLVPFSPLAAAELPENIDGLYLPGGYPELHAAQLSANEGLRQSIQTAVGSGLPTVAECGGFQYLHETLDGLPMAGALPLHARMTGKLQHFGYVTLTARTDGLLCPAGGRCRAHEFHYGVSDDAGRAFRAEKPNGRAWDGGFATETLYAGYPHLYFRGAPELAARFVRKCAERREK